MTVEVTDSGSGRVTEGDMPTEEGGDPASLRCRPAIGI